MEREFPKNVKQIGNVCREVKYSDDYSVELKELIENNKRNVFK